MGTVYRNLDAAKDYKSVSADTTLTRSDNGKVVLLDAIGEALTLPAVEAGLNYKFICTATTATTNWTIAAASAVIQGSAQVAGSVVAASDETTITLVIAKFLPGDWVTLESDGTNWYVEASVVTAVGITFA